jgi:hypothetical protein
MTSAPRRPKLVQVIFAWSVFAAVALLPTAARATSWCEPGPCVAYYAETLRADWNLWGDLADTRVVQQAPAPIWNLWADPGTTTVPSGLGDGLLTSANGFELSYEHTFAPTGVMSDIIQASVLVYVWDPSWRVNFAEVAIEGSAGTLTDDGWFWHFGLFGGNVTGILELDDDGTLDVTVSALNSFRVAASVLKVAYNDCPVTPEPISSLLFAIGIASASLGAARARIGSPEAL